MYIYPLLWRSCDGYLARGDQADWVVSINGKARGPIGEGPFLWVGLGGTFVLIVGFVSVRTSY